MFYKSNMDLSLKKSFLLQHYLYFSNTKYKLSEQAQNSVRWRCWKRLATKKSSESTHDLAKPAKPIAQKLARYGFQRLQLGSPNRQLAESVKHNYALVVNEHGTRPT